MGHELLETIMQEPDNRPLGRWLLDMAASIRTTVKGRRLISLRYEQGVWVQKDKHGVIVNWKPKHKWSLATFEAKTKDYFCSVYRPRPGDVVLDVGAGVGSEAYYFSRAVGANGRVIAIEAHPDTCLCLRKFCEYNQLRNVTVMNTAVSDRRSEVLISGDEKHVSNTILNATSGTRVKATSLDELVDDLALARIDFIKMNIEGAEKLAIRGMDRTLKKTGTVCISCHDFKADQDGDEALRTKTAVREFLVEKGFRVTTRDDDARPWVRDQLNAINPNVSPVA
jgi:FkbM family methyltransferase